MNIKNYLLSAALLFAAGDIYGFGNVTSGWTIYSCSSEETSKENASASNVLDGDENTFWHTKWSDGSDSYPHTIVFLSDGTISLNAISILPRQTNTCYNPTSVKFLISNDGQSWSDIGTYSLANDGLKKIINLPKTITPNYLKLFFAEGYSTSYLTLAEIEFLHYSEANIEFDDDHVKNICVQNWDTNDDGEISEFEAYAVTELGTAFRGNTDITSFNELSYFISLKNISAEAFMGCSNLEEATLPDGIQGLGTRAFKGCTNLSSINIPTDWTFIANTVFDGCTSLDSDVLDFIESISGPVIEFADPTVKTICATNWDTNGDGELSYAEAAAVTSITNYSGFEGNTTITSFNELQYFTGLTSIYWAFQGCSSLTSITLPDGVTSINGAFSMCSSLTSITFPNGITTIGEGAFRGCSSLTSITIPDGVTSIGQSAFDGCSNLTSITLPDGVTNIGRNAFYNCHGLTSIILPDGIITIGVRAFSNCSNLTSVTLPDGVIIIDDSAFYGCSSLTSINIPDGVTTICGSAFSHCSSLTSITIPNSVTTIGAAAFEGCPRLTSISIPDEITTIEYYAFRECSNLTSITIPDGVTTLEYGAFMGCSSLTSITIPDGVTNIGNSAFMGCTSLTSINIPDGVTTIEEGTFYGCNHLITIHFASTTPKVTYRGWGTEPVLFVPDAAIDAYKTAWPDYAARVVPESMSEYVFNVTVYAQNNASDVIAKIGETNALKVVNLKVKGSINSYDVIVFRDKMLNLRNLDLSEATIVASEQTYYDQTYKTKDNVFTGFMAPATLESIILPTSITALDEYALYECSYLKNLIIPESVTTIGSGAFFGCSNLQSITLPSGITEIPSWAFGVCNELTSISLPSNIATIGSFAFSGCIKLSSIDLPKDLLSVGDYAFSSCGSLTSIDLPKGLKTIGSYAFEDCSNLTQVKIPPYVESMGGSAFYGCSKLNTIYVYIPDYTLNVNENAFSTYTTAELRIPGFLYRDYYYNEGGWKRFINIVPCTLEPGDYETLPTNSDTSISGNDEVIPKIDEDTPIDGEINSEGSITVTPDVDDEHPQEFDTVDQIIDGEGQGGSLIGEDDGTHQGNLAVNTLRVKINVKAGRWYFFCFPYDVTIANCTYPGQYAWRYYDGEARAAGNNGWKPVEGTTLTALQGYAFQTSHTGNLIISFNTPTFGGDRPKTLVAHASGNAANASWNFVGNPYSSFYDFIATDFSSPVTVYDSGSGTYTAFRPGDDDLHLEPYQAFFVQKPEETAAILFDADRRESYRQGQAKNAERAQVRRMQGITPERRLINLEILDGETTMDKTRVVLNEKKSRDYELDCDASKFLSNEAEAQLYSIENGINMAINERPLQGDIRLGYTAKKAGRLSIGAPRMDMPMVLVDTKLNTTFDLSLGTYDFDTAAGSFNDRFLLRPSDEATAINAMTAKTGVCIGKQDGGIAIGGAEGKTINVYTTNGAQSAQHDGNGFIALKRGVYVVSVDGVSAKVRVK